jgi:predicted permease
MWHNEGKTGDTISDLEVVTIFDAIYRTVVLYLILFAAMRLVLIPALAVLFCRLCGFHTLLPMMLIITCMPCGLNTIVFPKLIGEDCKPGARLALITHIFSIITLPFWLSMIL